MIKRYFPLLALIFLSTACANKKLQTISILGEALALNPDPTQPDVWIYRHPSLKVSNYTKFLIDPVDIYSRQYAGKRGISPDQNILLAQGFWAEAVDALQGYPITDAPGPAVLRIKIHIRDIHPAHVEFDENKFLLMRFDTEMESGAMEIVCSDSVSNERVIAFVHNLSGSSFRAQENTTRLNLIKEAFRVWALSLRQRLDNANRKDKHE